MMSAPAIDHAEEDELDMNLLEKCDKTLRRRMYLRKMRQIYREEEKQERQYLLNKVNELEEILTPLAERARTRKETLLPWKDIALELDEERIRSVLQNEDLKSEVEEYEQLVRNMKKWVASNSVLKFSLDGCISTWRDSSLLANPQSRHLGKEWITKQLYYNTTRMFRMYGFPEPNAQEDFHLFDVLLSEDVSCGVQYILGGQFDLDVPVDCLSALYCQQTCSVLMANFQRPPPRNTVKEVDGNTILHQMVTANGEFVNVLVTCFQESDRFVAVVQDIIDDETVQEYDQRRRYRTYWVEIICLPSGKWKRRFLYLFSQRCDLNGPTTLEEEALIWGCNLDQVQPELRQARFRHEFMKMCSRLCAKGGFFHPRSQDNRMTR